MAYQGDDRGGGDRWREREQGRWSDGGGRPRGHYGSDDRGGYRGQGGGDWDDGRRGGHDERGFFERATEGVRSFFGGHDDDDDRGGERWERERATRRDNGYRDQGNWRERDHGPGMLGGGGFGRGWGNQAGESWNRDRPGERGWFTDSVGGERGHRYGAGGGSMPDQGRRPERQGGGGSPRYTPMTGDYGRSGSVHDPHYSEWRRRQMDELDRDYDEYRREHQSKFEAEFGGWRQKRQGQRQMLGRVAEHMEVVGSDGSHVGKVDKVRGDRIILAKNDPAAGGMHHSIPCGWVDNVDERVTLNRTAEQAMNEWRDEERNRALFEQRGDRASEGPHVLNRSFSGTYRDRDE